MAIINGKGSFRLRGNGAAVSSSIVSGGLVLNLKGNDSSSYSGSGAIWYDIAPPSQDATLLNGPIYSAATKGGVFAFDGVNDYALSSGTTLTTSANTVSIWFKLYDGANSYTWASGYACLLTSTSSAGYLNLQCDYMGNIITYNPTAGWATTGNGALDVTKYNQITITRTATTQILYVNGVQKSSITVGTGGTNSGLYIGKGYYGYFRGNIGEVQVYNKVLSSSEVTQNYDATKTRYV